MLAMLELLVRYHYVEEVPGLTEEREISSSSSEREGDQDPDAEGSEDIAGTPD